MSNDTRSVAKRQDVIVQQIAEQHSYQEPAYASVAALQISREQEVVINTLRKENEQLRTKMNAMWATIDRLTVSSGKDE
jgi:hypothetical protein